MRGAEPEPDFGGYGGSQIHLACGGNVSSRIRRLSENRGAHRIQSPGAEVYYDTRLLPEKTPTTIDVEWYGQHTVTFVREGHPPSKYVIDIKAPKHLWVPLDFFVTILPFTITDRHEFHFDLDETQAKGE